MSLSGVDSSDVLSLLRMPARLGVAGFVVDSTMTDFGRYLGRAVVCAVVRKVEERVTRDLRGVSDSLAVTTPCSSTDIDGFMSELRLFARVAVLESPRLSLLPAGDFTLPTELRPPAVTVLATLATLARREWVAVVTGFASWISFPFFPLSNPLPSDLFITSARAFPIEARLSDWRREVRVVLTGGRRPPAPGVMSVDMSRDVAQDRRESRK